MARPRTSIRSTFRSSAVVGTPAAVIAHYRPHVHAGMHYFIAAVVGSDVETVRLLAETVAPELQLE